MKRITLIAFATLGLLCPLVTASAARAGMIEGTVTPIAIAPEVEVCLVQVVPSEFCVAPLADGTYRLTDVPGGGQRVEFRPSSRSGYLTQYYNHKSSLAEATNIQVNPDSKIPSREIDADLILGAKIQGTVTAADGGAALSEVEVCALSPGARASVDCAETNVAGEYTLAPLPTGFYKVGFWGRGASAAYASQFYADAPSFSSATPITVTAGSVTGSIDVELARGAAIEGGVTAAGSGAQLAGVPVCLFGATASRPERCAFTDGGGGYSFLGLAAGDYQVGFSLTPAEVGTAAIEAAEDGYLSQYWRGAGSRSEATTISLLPGVRATGIGAALGTPPPPAPAPVIAPVASPVVAAPPVIAEPAPKKKKKNTSCKRGFKKTKVKGKTRCVKVPSKGHHKHKKHKHGSKK